MVAGQGTIALYLVGLAKQILNIIRWGVQRPGQPQHARSLSTRMEANGATAKRGPAYPAPESGRASRKGSGGGPPKLRGTSARGVRKGAVRAGGAASDLPCASARAPRCSLAARTAAAPCWRGADASGLPPRRRLHPRAAPLARRAKRRISAVRKFS